MAVREKAGLALQLKECGRRDSCKQAAVWMNCREPDAPARSRVSVTPARRLQLIELYKTSKITRDQFVGAAERKASGWTFDWGILCAARKGNREHIG